MTRRVRHLQEVAEALAPGNRRGGGGFPLRGATAEGLRYESRVAALARSLGLRVKHGQWFRFRDAGGVGYCQPDVLALSSAEGHHRLLVIEAKLTQTREGEAQLSRLYVPLMARLYQVPIIPILIFRNILWEAERQLGALEDALRLPVRSGSAPWHLHWSDL